VRAITTLQVGLDASGRSVLRRTHCEVPLVVRVDTGCTDGLGLLIVNAAAGPLGGDELTLSLTIDDGASVRVRSVAASMVHPGPTGAPSLTTTHVRVGALASLDWELEAMVSVALSDHRACTVVEAHPSATIRMAETLSLGRHGEPGGRLALRQRLVVGGTGVLDHETAFGPGAASGPGAQGSMRCVRSTLLVGDDAPTTAAGHVVGRSVVGIFPLAPRCALLTSAADTLTLLHP
jgi:urease accessory protein